MITLSAGSPEIEVSPDQVPRPPKAPPDSPLIKIPPGIEIPKRPPPDPVEEEDIIPVPPPVPPDMPPPEPPEDRAEDAYSSVAR